MMIGFKLDAGPNPPCGGCAGRTASCHAGCRLYEEWRKEHVKAYAEAYGARRRERWEAESRRWRWKAS